MNNYILNDDKTISQVSEEEGRLWRERNPLHMSIRRSEVSGALVSTIFAQHPMGYTGSGQAPNLFETMVFGDHPLGHVCIRSTSYGDAIEGHTSVINDLEAAGVGGPVC